MLLTGKSLSWPKVIVFAFATAAVTALLNVIPFLKNTSFTDPATYPEVWILFALIIICRSEKWYEAVLKTFVFFLVSQPLIYLIEVPFSSLGFGLFMYYKRWFIITLLTIPGAAIAFLVKKGNILSSIILSVATSLVAMLLVVYVKSFIAHFPFHLLSAVFCGALIVYLIIVLLPGKRERIITSVITGLALIGSSFYNPLF